MMSALTDPRFLLALFAAIQLLYASVEGSFVPTRCLCPNTNKTIKGPFENLSVIEKGAHCHADEIILTLRANKQKVCLSPDGRQGKQILRCWRGAKKNGDNGTLKCRRPKRVQKQKSRRPGKATSS